MDDRPNNATARDVEAALSVAHRLAQSLARFATARGAKPSESVKCGEISARVLPALLWLAHNDEIELRASSFVETGKLGGFGVAVSVLNRGDIPLRLRSQLFPVLRPDAHQVSVLWWDEVAVPNWVAPFFSEIESLGDFAGSVALI